MAKKHKNLDNLPIQWDGDIVQPTDGSTQSTPDNIDIVWGGYVPCWYDVIDDGSCTDTAGCGLYSECEAGIPLECSHEAHKCFNSYDLVTSLYFEDLTKS
jgi:hypothetical protein